MESIRWNGSQLLLLDQRVLPREELWITLRTSQEVAAAITDMVVRGAAVKVPFATFFEGLEAS